MKIRDVAVMALHNLWSRKLKTFLNLLGIIISCTMLVMTFAGTRGASDGIHAIVNQSEQIRKLVIQSSWGGSLEPPESAIEVDEDIDNAERRARIEEKLASAWQEEHWGRTLIDQDAMRRLREIEHVVYVEPNHNVFCEIVDGNTTAKAFVGGVRPGDDSTNARVLFGERLEPGDEEGVLLNEFQAYQLGYLSDEDLENLIGKKLTFKYLAAYRNSGLRMLSRIGELTGDASISELGEMMLVLNKLDESLDATDLADDEKELLRAMVSGVVDQATGRDTEPESEDATDNEADSPSKKELENESENQLYVPQLDGFKVTVGEDGEVFLQRDLFVRGVTYQPEHDDMWSILNVVYESDGGAVELPFSTLEQLAFQARNMKGFYSAVAKVDDVRNLRSVVDQIEAEGFESSSGVQIVEQIDHEIGKIRIAIAGIALLILLIAALGITNTMIIAVLQRTQEFGIMKSLGARNSHVMLLMLMEGAVTGIIGAAIAVLVSLGLSFVIDGLVRSYIESRIGDSFTQSTFVFSLLDVIIVFLVSAFVCTVASLLPAWRAARLDPVVAMKRG